MSLDRTHEEKTVIEIFLFVQLKNIRFVRDDLKSNLALRLKRRTRLENKYTFHYDLLMNDIVIKLQVLCETDNILICNPSALLQSMEYKSTY